MLAYFLYQLLPQVHPMESVEARLLFSLELEHGLQLLAGMQRLFKYCNLVLESNNPYQTQETHNLCIEAGAKKEDILQVCNNPQEKNNRENLANWRRYRRCL